MRPPTPRSLPEMTDVQRQAIQLRADRLRAWAGELRDLAKRRKLTKKLVDGYALAIESTGNELAALLD